MIKHITIANG